MQVDSPYPDGVACEPDDTTAWYTATPVTASPTNMYACICQAGFSNGACGYDMDTDLQTLFDAD